MIKTVKIEGMSCGHCTASVESALRAVAGVTDVKVDLAAQSATVVGDAPMTGDALAEAVSGVGFDVVGVE